MEKTKLTVYQMNFIVKWYTKDNKIGSEVLGYTIDSLDFKKWLQLRKMNDYIQLYNDCNNFIEFLRLSYQLRSQRKMRDFLNEAREYGDENNLERVEKLFSMFGVNIRLDRTGIKPRRTYMDVFYTASTNDDDSSM